jgi:hypothetical protein
MLSKKTFPTSHSKTGATNPLLFRLNDQNFSVAKNKPRRGIRFQPFYKDYVKLRV